MAALASVWVWGAVFIAGGLGALLRVLLGLRLQAWQWHGVALGTLVANTLGCFLLGLLSVWLLTKFPVQAPWLKLVLLGGFLGALTTFASYLAEGVALQQAGAWAGLLMQLFLHHSLGFLAFFLGTALAQRVTVS